MRELLAFWLGCRRYSEVHAFQQRMLERRREGTIGDTVFFLEHDPVITLGRGAHASNVLASPHELRRRGVDVAETARGGDVTLHAPGQLVCYPILDLSSHYRDVRRYVTSLAEVMQRVVAGYGVCAGTVPGQVGLWVDRACLTSWPGAERARELAKIGAIGVRISRWITMHGFALNLTTDLSLFQLIVPCGIREHPVTSLEALSGAAPSPRIASERAYAAMADIFGLERRRMIDGSATELNALI